MNNFYPFVFTKTHYIQVNLYIYKQVALYIVDQPYQNGWSSVSELINNGLVNVLDGLPYRNIWTSISTLYNSPHH